MSPAGHRLITCRLSFNFVKLFFSQFACAPPSHYEQQCCFLCHQHGIILDTLTMINSIQPGVKKKPKKFKTVWRGFQEILKLSGRVNQASLKLSAGFSNTVCWTS